MAANSPESKQKLIQMLKELGVAHYDAGGAVNQAPDLKGNPQTTQSHGGYPTTGQTFTTAGDFYHDPQGAAQGVTDITGQGLQDFAGAFTAQNGYQAGLAPTTQMNYAPAIGQAGSNALNGYGQQQQLQGQQQGLANQYGQQAMGQGPNPAQAMLNQSTGQNVNAQAALMAGQRGSSQNVGMMARQIGNAGAQTQQQGIGQAATLQAQQSIAAQQQQAALFGQMGQQNIAEQQVNAGIFGTAAGANNAQNTGNIQNYSQMQGINSTIAQNNANATNQTMGGLMSGAGMLASMLKDGGKVEDAPQKFADGGMGSIDQAQATSGAMPYVPPGLSSVPLGQGTFSNIAPKMPSMGGGGDAGGSEDAGTGMAAMADGGETPKYAMKHLIKGSPHQDRGRMMNALVSPGEILLDPEQARAAAVGKSSAKRVLPMAKWVPGHASVSGNSYQNDTVPAKLEKGGVVIPRSISQKSKNLPEDAARFVAAALAKKGKK